MEITLNSLKDPKGCKEITDKLIAKDQLLIILAIGANDSSIVYTDTLIGQTGKLISYDTPHGYPIKFEFTNSIGGMKRGSFLNVTFGVVHSAENLDSVMEEISVHRGTDLENASDNLTTYCVSQGYPTNMMRYAPEMYEFIKR